MDIPLTQHLNRETLSYKPLQFQFCQKWFTFQFIVEFFLCHCIWVLGVCLSDGGGAFNHAKTSSVQPPGPTSRQTPQWEHCTKIKHVNQEPDIHISHSAFSWSPSYIQTCSPKLMSISVSSSYAWKTNQIFPVVHHQSSRRKYMFYINK